MKTLLNAKSLDIVNFSLSMPVLGSDDMTTN